MPRTLILNNKNVVSGTNNARYLYKFPNSVQFKDTQIAVASVNMYYSWFSITSDIGNNSFQYVWYGEDTPGTAGGTNTLGSSIGAWTPSGADQDVYARLNWSMMSYSTYTASSLTDFTQKSGSGADQDTLVCGKSATYTVSYTATNAANSNGDTLVYAVCVNDTEELTATITTQGESISISGTITLNSGDEINVKVKDSTQALTGTTGQIAVGAVLTLAEESSSSTTVDITIPDGFYSIDDLNAYLQSQMVSNGHYLEDSVGDYVYYLELTTNASQYAVQFNSYPIPTALPTGYSNLASITFPATATTPQIIISSDNTFQDIIGIDAGTNPSSTQDSNYSHTSDYTPQVTPTQSLILACSLLNNPYANPNTLLYSFAPTGTSFGSLISSSPNELVYVDIQDGVYSEFFIEFLDQNLSQLSILDNNLVVMLVVKQKGE